MYYFCCDENRRDAVIDSSVNGIDFIEVIDDPSLPNEQRQRTLLLYFVKPLGALVLSANNIEIHGGERIRDIHVLSVNPGTDSHVLEITVDVAGDFSIYTLCLVTNTINSDPPAGFDPVLSTVDFSFKVECPSDFDCRQVETCEPEVKAKPPINYLAKDYASFRRLMLDRLSLVSPNWKERNPADQGMSLVELLAYMGDHLSYQQDAVQTEGYFDLARQRISLRRHARLVDYFMHDGCNARTWVQVQVDADNVLLEHEFMVDGELTTTKFLSALDNLETIIEPNSRDWRAALKQKPLVFEPIPLSNPDREIRLFSAHNEMLFYTWSDTQCCLPRGATSATLQTHLPNLQVGDVLVFEEVKGPLTGAQADANPSHRQVIRLNQTPVLTTDPVTGDEVTDIHWHEEDALTFSVCISSRSDEQHGSVLVQDVSVVRGNMVLCDHGMSVRETLTESVPEPLLYYRTGDHDRCDRQEPQALPVRYRPSLGQLPLTQSAPYRHEQPARYAFQKSLREVKPAISLDSELGLDTHHWQAFRDLLSSQPLDNHFVVETENTGRVKLRFGDDIQGRAPEPGTTFTANYRVGNGSVGNIGVDAIVHAVTLENSITEVRNLLPAQGGMDMESMESVRRKAPYAYRTQERAVTEADYAEVTERQGHIQQAEATFRWTGSWHTVFLTIDRMQGLPVDDAFRDQIRQGIEKYRMAGHDIEVDAPRLVPLEIAMFVCVKPEYFRSHVKQALLEVFSRRGIFHPDNFTFGQTVYLSPLYQAAQSVAGVNSVKITVFQRLHDSESSGLSSGKLLFDKLEIPRLDNDPNFRERGLFSIELGGGK